MVTHYTRLLAVGMFCVLVMLFLSQDVRSTPSVYLTTHHSTSVAARVVATTTPLPPAQVQADADVYELDDTCSRAKALPIDGALQAHTFHNEFDTDWVKFTTTPGARYVIEALVPFETTAGIQMDMLTDCADEVYGSQAYTYTHDVHLEFTAPSDKIFLNLKTDTSVQDATTSYELGVRAVRDMTGDAAIIVGGILDATDPLHENIDYAVQQAHDFFVQQGYAEDQLFVMEAAPNVYGRQLAVVLQEAMTSWAPQKLAANGMLTVYVIGDGGESYVFLDKPQAEKLFFDDLHAWLDELASERLDVQVNVIVETPYAGSFLSAAQSSPHQLVIAATGPDAPAWMTSEGAFFSDYFWAALERGSSFYSAFREVQWVVDSVYANWQTPLLDGNGDGTSNTMDDYVAAAKRGFGDTQAQQQADSVTFRFSDEYVPTDVVAGDEVWVGVLAQGDATLERVWAVVYPPSFNRNVDSLIDTNNPDTVGAQRVEGGKPWRLPSEPWWFKYAFTQAGTYRFVAHAKTASGQDVLPVKTDILVEEAPPTPTPMPTPTPTPVIEVPKTVFLPLVRR